MKYHKASGAPNDGASRSARTARIEIQKEGPRPKPILASRSARTARIEISSESSAEVSVPTVAVRKDRKD